MDDHAELIRRGRQASGVVDNADGKNALIRDLCDALEASHPVKVKALEWRDHSFGNNILWTAQAVFEDYRIIKEDADEWPYVLRPFINGQSNYQTVDDAKAAAEAHYERCILSALEAAPAVPDGCREAIRQQTIQDALQQARRVRNYSNPEDVFIAIPVAAISAEKEGQPAAAPEAPGQEAAEAILALSTKEGAEGSSALVKALAAARALRHDFNHPTKGIEAVRLLVEIKLRGGLPASVSALIDELADSVDAAYADIGGCRSHRAILDDLLCALEGASS